MTVSIKLPSALYIGSEWVPVPGDAMEPVVNPATEEVIALAPVARRSEADAAIAAAREAFDKGPWPRMSGRQRAVKLQAFVDALKAREAEIKYLIQIEAGATLLAQYVQFDIPLRHAQHFIDLSAQNPVKGLPVDVNSTMSGIKLLGAGVTVREPVGVVAAITPYNFPFFMNVAKVLPAMAAGNTVVLKPAPYTPFEALVLGEAATQAGLPEGVLNIITGAKEVGEMLTTDRRIDLITFTGSDTVGAAIQAQTAPTLKRLLLELGGKSALIVRHDANLDQALQAGLFNFTWHAGQGCNLNTRHLVHNSVRGEYVRRLGEMARTIKVGNPADSATGMGPLIREAQRRRTESYVEVALSDGARLVAGGRRPAGFDRGFFYEPTLFDDVDNRSRIAQEEVFGPIGVVIGYDSDEEAVALANDSQFGLSGGIFSADVGRAYELALQIRTGEVYLNGGSGGMSSYAPFGGIKRSGYGREYGADALNEYSYVKTVVFHAG